MADSSDSGGIERKTGSQQQYGSQKQYAEHRGCSPAYISKIKREGKLVLVPGTKRVDFAATDRMLDATSDPDKEGVRDRWRYERGAANSCAGDQLLGQNSSMDSGSCEIESSRPQKSSAAIGDTPAPGDRAGERRPELSELSAATFLGGSGGDAQVERPDAVEGRTAGANRDPLYEERLQAQVRILRLDEQKKQIELAESAGKLILVSEAQERMHAYGRQIRDMFLAMPARIQADLAAEPDPNAVGRRLNEEIKATLHELTRRVAAEPGADREAGTA